MVEHIQGFVEIHNENSVSGWCIDKTNTNAPVELDVFCGDLWLTRIRTDIHRTDIFRAYNAPKSGFSFEIRASLRDLLPKNTLLRIIANESFALPYLFQEKIVGIGLANDNGTKLTKILLQGCYVNKWGEIRRPFSSMSAACRAEYVQSLADIHNYFINTFGLPIFPHYGTLLGYARGGAFLPHDDDIDMSFLTNARSIEEVAEDFFEIADKLISDGHYVNIVAAGQMHVKLADKNHAVIDIFSSWIDRDREFRTYFGVGGTLKYRGLAFEIGTLEGVDLLIPSNFEEILSFTYGPTWRVPDPMFKWSIPPKLREQMEALKRIGSDRLGVFNPDALSPHSLSEGYTG
jgi:hypothetical protein